MCPLVERASGQPTLSASESESDMAVCGDSSDTTVTGKERPSMRSAVIYGRAPCQDECLGGWRDSKARCPCRR